MIHPTPTQTLLTTTFEPLVMQLSSSLTRGARIINQFVQAAPTPEATMAFELELDTLLREVGRRIMAWTLNPPRSVATLFGPVTLRRRLYERLGRSGSGRSVHPLELGLGLEAGLATPALAERVGRLATEHSQQEVREMLQSDYGVHWSCTSVRKVLGSLRAGMAPHREGAQIDQLLSWLEQARASTGRLRPTLWVGRDGIFVRLRHGVWQEGATATIAVLDRRGKRVGTAYLGQMPEAGQGTLTDQMSPLLKAILIQVASQSLRLAYVTDEGYPPSGYYHPGAQKHG